MTTSFAELLRNHRLSQGLTQKALAEKVGVTRCYIALLEQGARQNPSREHLSQIANALNLSAEKRQQFFLSLQGGGTTAISKARATSPLLEKLSDFLELPPHSPLGPQKLSEAFERLEAIVSEKGFSKGEKKTAKLQSLLTMGYMYTPARNRQADVARKPKISRSKRDEIRMSNRFRSLLEIFVDGRIPISKRVSLAEELLSLAKWRCQVPPKNGEKNQ